jgi:spore coat protein U-like protein
MKRPNLLRPLLLLLLLLCGALLMPRSAHAAGVTCTATVSPNLNFASYDPQVGTVSTQTTLNWTCTASSTFFVGSSATMCFSIGTGTGGGTQTSPRQMTGGTGTPLQYQIYSQANQGLAWGSVTNNNSVIRQVAFQSFGDTTQSGSITIYGSILGIQPGVTEGVYTSSFTGANAMLSVASAQALFNPPAYPASCGNGNDANFPFSVQATVLRTCTVTAGAASNIDFGNVPANTSGSLSATSNIQVTCLNGTPYIVGLQTTDGSAGSGRMSGIDPGNTADKVAYVLHRTSATGPVWGNTGTAPGTSVGNDVGGNGNGLAQSIPVYAVVADANHIPGHYVDTVTVYVTY